MPDTNTTAAEAARERPDTDKVPATEDERRARASGQKADESETERELRVRAAGFRYRPAR